MATLRQLEHATERAEDLYNLSKETNNPNQFRLYREWQDLARVTAEKAKTTDEKDYFGVK
jgi:hypothetical protein